MTTTKPFNRSDFDYLIHSFVDEDKFPWLDPCLHERFLSCFFFYCNIIKNKKKKSYLFRDLITHELDIDRLFTIESLNDEYDLVADRNLTSGEIIGLDEVKFLL